MSSVKIKIKPLREDCKLPERKTSGASCLDLYACMDVTMYPNDTRIIRTGFALELPPGVEGQIRPRSGLASRGIAAHFGTIDSDYRGEVKVILINMSKKKHEIRSGDRIAQLAINSTVTDKLVFLVTECLSETKRGEKGFGSTGD